MNGELILVQDVALCFATLIAQKIQSNPELIFVGSGGPTAKACYEKLTQIALSQSLQCSKITILLTDERCFAPKQDSNSEMILQTLVKPLKIKNFYPLNCEDTKDYENLLSEIKLDIIHLGMGPDGHTASLFPGLNNYETKEKLIKTSDPNLANPYQRISLTLNVINSAELAIFTVSGHSKHDALKAIMQGADLPAGKVSTKKLLWLVDSEAYYG
jgi:6-phosphogluconolactonase